MYSLLHRLKAAIPDRHPIRLFWHTLKAFLAALRYGFPARNLTVIGITGTDGKTTTVAMTTHILHAAGINVGAVSTTFFQIGGEITQNPTHKTSMAPSILQGFLKRCADAGCSVVVVEVSSHGLVQHRLDFLRPAVAAITNTSLEHLDYHGTMEQYRADKAILFRMLRGKGTKVLNADDETSTLYDSFPSKQTIRYSTSGRACVFRAEDITVAPQGTSARIRSRDGDWRLHLRIPGVFNVANALCAISCAYAAGVPASKATEALADFPGVLGRMERIDEGQSFSVFVDFTVSPKAYEETLTTARKLMTDGKKLLVLTGSCGDRMREKRPMIGEICSRLADVVVVSEDETVTEDPLKVIDEVWAGVDQTKTGAHKIVDRREAICFLFEKAQPADVVLLCGMGACSTMQTREGLRPWDEREIAREELRKMAKN